MHISMIHHLLSYYKPTLRIPGHIEVAFFGTIPRATVFAPRQIEVDPFGAKLPGTDMMMENSLVTSHNIVR